MSTKPLKLGELSLFVQETARQKMNGVGYFSFFLVCQPIKCKVARNHHAPMVIVNFTRRTKKKPFFYTRKEMWKKNKEFLFL